MPFTGFLLSSIFQFFTTWPLAGVAQWIERQRANWTVIGA